MFSDVHLLCPDAAVCSRKIKSLTQRHHRSPVHLNWLFPQTLSSFSAAILKGHRVLGTMGQCMLGYIGSRPDLHTLLCHLLPGWAASCLATEAIAICSGSFSLKLQQRLYVTASPIFKFSFEVKLHLNPSCQIYATFEIQFKLLQSKQ